MPIFELEHQSVGPAPFGSDDFSAMGGANLRSKLFDEVDPTVKRGATGERVDAIAEP